MRGASSAVTARPPAIVPESSPQETTRQPCLLKEEATWRPHLGEKNDGKSCGKRTTTSKRRSVRYVGSLVLLSQIAVREKHSSF